MSGVAAGGPADLAFVGGPVHTMDPTRPHVSAVAVRGGRIVAMGEEATALIGPGTDVVDLAGRALLPGIGDAHVHPVFAGQRLASCDLGDAAGADDALARVAAYAAARPDLEWISGGGWSQEWFPRGTPAKEPLDAVVPDRPVFLINRDGHGAWVNSRALELASIDATTPDPSDGRIERDAAGAPQGTLHEGAVDLVSRLVPAPSRAEQVRALLAAQRHLHALGVTAWQDAIVGPYLGDDDPFETYLEAAESGALTARVVGALWWDRNRGAEQIEELVARRERAGGRRGVGRFRATSVKIMQDGVAENYTAGMIEPYLDGCGCPTENRGLSHVDPAALPEYVTRLDAAGFQVHFHAIGDRAVREALDAVAAARARRPHGGRHHIAHIQVIHPDDVPRFAALAVTANCQPLWAVHEPQMDELTIPFLGPRRAGWQYPFAGLLRAGARLAAGSDWAVSSPNPFWGMHAAVNRRLPGERDTPVFLPEQRLDLVEALAAYTLGTAWVNQTEHETGSITVGKLADLVVTDRDPFAQPVEEIGDTRVLATFVEGEPVYTASSF